MSEQRKVRPGDLIGALVYWKTYSGKNEFKHFGTIDKINGNTVTISYGPDNHRVRRKIGLDAITVKTLAKDRKKPE